MTTQRQSNHENDHNATAAQREHEIDYSATPAKSGFCAFFFRFCSFYRLQQASFQAPCSGG